jgi:hypothetical protein
MRLRENLIISKNVWQRGYTFGRPAMAKAQRFSHIFQAERDHMPGFEVFHYRARVDRAAKRR